MNQEEDIDLFINDINIEKIYYYLDKNMVNDIQKHQIFNILYKNRDMIFKYIGVNNSIFKTNCSPDILFFDEVRKMINKYMATQNIEDNIGKIKLTLDFIDVVIRKINILNNINGFFSNSIYVKYDYTLRVMKRVLEETWDFELENYELELMKL